MMILVMSAVLIGVVLSQDMNHTLVESLQMDFTFLDNTYTTVYIHSDGFLTFEPYDLTASPFDPFPSEGHAILAPYWLAYSDDVTYNSTVDYRVVTSSDLLSEVKQTISRSLQHWNPHPSDPGPVTSSAVITWSHLSISKDNYTAQLPAIEVTLATTEGSSFVILDFEGDIEEFGPMMEDIDMIAWTGANKGDGYAFYTLPTSGLDWKAVMLDLVTSSNIGDSGKWVMRVDNTTWGEQRCSRCVRSCPPLAPPPHGTVTSLQLHSSSSHVVQYSCHDGYVIHGNHGYSRRTCLIDGSWTGEELVCEEREGEDGGDLVYLWILLPVLVVVAVLVVVMVMRHRSRGAPHTCTCVCVRGERSSVMQDQLVSRGDEQAVPSTPHNVFTMSNQSHKHQNGISSIPAWSPSAIYGSTSAGTSPYWYYREMHIDDS